MRVRIRLGVIGVGEGGGLLPTGALLEELHERSVELHRGVEGNVVGAECSEFAAPVVLPAEHGFAIAGASAVGIGGALGAGLGIDEADMTAEVQLGFGDVENVHDDQVVAAEANGVERLAEFVLLGKEVAQDDDEPAMGDAMEGVDDAGGESGVAVGFCTRERGKQVEQIGAACAGREEGTEFVLDDAESDGVLLVDDEIAECGGEIDRVFELGDVVVGGLADGPHARGSVDEQVAVEVSLGLVFADVEPVGAAEDVPIDGAQVVAARILAMLAEFDAEPLEW